jgi:hypothetical protein
MSARELTCCFRRLGNLDGGAFERLGRYNATLWKQAAQTMLLLASIRRLKVSKPGPNGGVGLPIGVLEGWSVGDAIYRPCCRRGIWSRGALPAAARSLGETICTVLREAVVLAMFFARFVLTAIAKAQHDPMLRPKDPAQRQCDAPPACAKD